MQFLGQTSAVTADEVARAARTRGSVWLWIEEDGELAAILRRGDIVEVTADGLRALWRGMRGYRLDRAPWRWLAGRAPLWQVADRAWAAVLRAQQLTDQFRPMPKDAAEVPRQEEARTYSLPQILEWYANSISDGLHDTELALLEGKLRAGERVLVVGCGAGREARALARRGQRVHGIDVCEPMLEQARQAVPDARFELASLATYAPPPASFDAVLIASDVYRHVPGRACRVAALGRMREALRPGGLLWVAASVWGERPIVRLVVDGPRALLRPIFGARVPEAGDRWHRHPSDPRPAYHHRFASEAEIAAEIRDAGFTAIEQHGGFFEARAPGVAEAVVAKRYRARPDVHATPTGAELLLVQLSGGNTFSLNRTGRAIWDLALAGLSIDEIADRLHQATGAPTERIARDARELLESLAAGSLLDREASP